MLIPKRKTILSTFCILGGMLLSHFSAWAGVMAFSLPERLTTISWSNGSNHGVSPNGAEWLMVDSHGRYWLESDLDFRIYAPDGRYLQTVSPIDKRMNFYGFAAMEALPDGRIVLLQRLETPAEQSQKLNYENRSQPGVRLMVLKADGTVERDEVVVDPQQPHSDYYVECGNIYSIHDDGTYVLLDSIGSSPKDKAFGGYAAVDDPRRWLDHVKTLPIFHCENRYYQDTDGKLHVDKNAKTFLMGHPLVEGSAPLAERKGTVYYRVVCYLDGQFTRSVFVEDALHKNFALIDLQPANEDMEAAHNRALFVDQKGNLFEGVVEKDGYRIYEWKNLN